MEYFIRSRYLGTNFGEANRALLEAKLVEQRIPSAISSNKS
jgi:hypothetical protein